jgi:hypothetical protein
MRATGQIFHTVLKSSVAALAGIALLAPAPGFAQGNLLIAPTRLVLDGRRGDEVILSNIGSEEETYRVSLELRRMDENGRLVTVKEADATASEKAALEMIRYAPRRVTLPPSQPQAIRISVRPGADLPDGEYRVHMSFAALPKVIPVTETSGDKNGIAISLVPVYGIVMPIIVRKGELTVTAGLASPRIVHGPKGDMFALDMTRAGSESVYGDLFVYPQGAKEPAFIARGIGVYPEIATRHAAFSLSPEQAEAMKGPAKVEFREAVEIGGALIASVDTVLR